MSLKSRRVDDPPSEYLCAAYQATRTVSDDACRPCRPAWPQRLHRCDRAPDVVSSLLTRYRPPGCWISVDATTSLTWRGEAKKVTRPPGRTPGLSPRQCNRVASPGKARAALSSLTLTLTFSSKLQLLLRSDAFTPGETSPLHCRHDQAGSSPRRATYFFCFAKKSRQKKATR